MAAPTLGALTLPDQIIWVDQYSYIPIVGQAERTLGGAIVLFNQAASKGRPITLEARDGVAWLTQAQIDSIITMASSLGTAYLFTYNGESYDVQFAHAIQPVVEFTPIWPLSDTYTGVINLITV